MSQAAEIRERLARLYAGETLEVGTDTVLDAEPAAVSSLSSSARLAEPVSVPSSVAGLLDELERRRALDARGFDEDAIRGYLLRSGTWTAIRFTLFDGASNQVDEIRRRTKTLFPQVGLGNGRIARELVHIIKLADRDVADLPPAERPSPVIDGRLTDVVETAIAERRARALERAPLGDRQQEIDDAAQATRERTAAEDQVHRFFAGHGLADPDPELFALLAAGVWQGYRLELGGRDDNGRPWLHLWRARSATARIEKGVTLVLVEAMAQSRLVLARRTDTDAVRDGADQPTSRPEVVVDWLGLRQM